MILDQLNNAERWLALHPGFAPAIAFLRRKDLDQLANGRQEIDGPRLYAMVIRNTGVGRQKSKLEAHRKYIDIQLSVAGSDVIGWKSTPTCSIEEQRYEEKSDVELFGDTPDFWMTIHPGSLAIFFPEDAHAPMAAEELLHKVIAKVAVNWT